MRLLLNHKYPVLLFLLFSIFIKMQAQTISVNVTVNPPYDPNLFTYTSDPSKVLITLTNLTGSNQDLKLGATFRTVDGTITVATAAEYQPPQPLTLGPGETRLLTADDLYNLFPDQNSITSTGVDRNEVIRTRRLPAGIYQLCVTAYSYNSPGHTVPLSSVIPMGCSAPFRLGIINPPEIMMLGSVTCGGIMTTSEIQNFMIMWIAPPEVPVDIRYVIEMIELTPIDRNPMDAFESATFPIFFTDSVTSLTTYVYTEANPRLEQGRKYAVRIRVVDPNGGLRFANRGYSVPCTFTYGSSTGGRFNIQSVFPTDNTYIPWRYFPIIVRFNPYDNQLYRFNYNLNLTENGSSRYSRSDELRWPWGPSESQTRASGMTISESESQNLPVNESNAIAGQEFTRGTRFRYDVTGSFLHLTTRESQPIGVSCNDGFISGMGTPVNELPANESIQDSGRITLRFKTAEKPLNALPPYAIVSSGSSAAPASNFYNHGVEERYVLEVSREIAFTTVVQTVSRRFAPAVDLNACIANNDLLTDSIYRSLEHSLHFTDTGVYYWRVKWLINDRDPSSQAYVTGPVWNFRIGAAGPEIQTDTTRRTPPGCLADCASPDASDRTAVATLRNGETVRVGRFDMVVTEINWSGNNARGVGHIRVPFMNAPVIVTFSSIQINASRTMIAGEVITQNDNTSLVPSAVATATGTFTGLSETSSRELNEWLVTSRRLVSQLSGSEPIGMPLGIDNTIDGQRYTIGIMGCKFTPNIATLNALVSLDIPDLHGWLSLGANDICFHPGGLNLGQGKLFLPLDHQIGYSGDINFVLKAPHLPRDSGTYVSWDCQGFKELAISGEVNFPRSMLLPDNADGSAGTGQVQGRFFVKVQRLGNWICAIDMDAFQVAGLPEWGFSVEDAYLDFSDLQNATSMEFPEGYGGNRTALWRGFYLKRLAVRLPNEFKTYSAPDRRLTAAISNVLIDGTGLSAKFSVENLVRVEDGNLDGWAFSLDTVYLSMVSNDFRNAGLVGEIRLPISDRDDLNYRASLNRSSAGDFAFEFRIQPKDTFQAQLWEVTLSLNPSSLVNVVIDGEGFMAGADLSGSLSMSGSRGGGSGAQLDGVNLLGIHFEHFRINSRGPDYISVGSFARASEQHSAGGFPLSITDINITSRIGPSLMEFDQSPGPRFGIEFNINLSLTGESNTFSATAKIAFLGKLSLTGERQGWTFSGVNLDSIAVGGSVGCVSINGSLVFYNSHPIYGKGIKGYLRVEMQPTISVSATVQFGEVDGYRYWYVDAMATWSPGVTLFTGLDLRGLGGGAWYHMSEPTPVAFSSIRDVSGPRSESAGATSSGITYTPNQSIGLGFKVMIKIGATGGSSAYHGLITLGAQFVESTGGIERIYLRGDFMFMTESDDRREASVSADFNVEYNFVQQRFQANFRVFVNVADILRGVNANNMAGELEILVTPETWHIFIGQPSIPIGLRLTLGETELARAQFYVMVGEDLPPMPPMPDNIARILNVRIERDITNLERGDGFAMGTYINIGPLSAEVMPFYASIGLGFGFDLSVKKYTTRCEGMPLGATIGSNGWYARGQIYGYFEASVGLYVDLFFVKGRFEILGVQAAAYLQGGFPNPNWVEGAIAGRYSILNGAIQGNCHFAFSQGQKCVPPIENPMAGLELVASLSPEQLARDVDCGIEPTALYNYSIDREFSLTVRDMNDNPIVRTFRVKQKETKLTVRNAVTLVGGNVAMSEQNALLTYYTDSFLLPNTTHFWTTTAYAEERKSGTWTITRDLSDRPVQKKYTHIFVTGARPNRIREQDVLYSYPFNKQRFLLQEECRSGVLALKRSMAYLFQRPSSANYTWVYKARFTPIDGGAPIWTELHNITTANIAFSIPTLENQKVYQVDFVAVKTETAAGRLERTLRTGAVPNRNASIRNAIQIRSFGNSTIETSNNSTSAGSKTSEDLIVLYTYHFKTSQYNTISAKFAAQTHIESNKTGFGDVEAINEVRTGEGFDDYDVNRHVYVQSGVTKIVQPLVSFYGEWAPRTNIWMERQQYASYGFRDFAQNQGLGTYRFRSTRSGIPPISPVNFSDNYSTISLLSDNEIAPPTPSNSFGSGLSISQNQSRSIGFSSLSYSGPTMQHRILIFYGIPVISVLHRVESRDMARRIVAVYGLWGSEFLTYEQMVYLDYVLNQRYTKLTFGNYPVKVLYNPPTCGFAPDYDYSCKFNIVLPLR